MPVDIIDSLRVVAGVPTDDKFRYADLTARDALLSGLRYEGMIVHVLSNSKNYQLQGGITNGDWIELVNGGGGSGAFTDAGSNQITPTTANGNTMLNQLGSSILGGKGNTITAPTAGSYNTIAGGYNSTISGDKQGNFIGYGYNSNIYGSNSSVFGSMITVDLNSTEAFAQGYGHNFVNSGNNSTFGRYNDFTGANYSFATGYNNTIDHDYVAVFGRNITTNANDTTFVDNLNIKTVAAGVPVYSLAVDATGKVVQGAGGGGGAFTDQGSNQILTTVANGNSINATYGDNSAIIGGINNSLNTPGTIVGGDNVDVTEYISSGSYTKGHVALGKDIDVNPYDFASGTTYGVVAIGNNLNANYVGSIDPNYNCVLLGHKLTLDNSYNSFIIGYNISKNNVNGYVIMGSDKGVILSGVTTAVPTNAGGLYRIGNALYIKT